MLQTQPKLLTAKSIEMNNRLPSSLARSPVSTGSMRLSSPTVLSSPTNETVFDFTAQSPSSLNSKHPPVTESTISQPTMITSIRNFTSSLYSSLRISCMPPSNDPNIYSRKPYTANVPARCTIDDIAPSLAKVQNQSKLSNTASHVVESSVLSTRPSISSPSSRYASAISRIPSARNSMYDDEDRENYDFIEYDDVIERDETVRLCVLNASPLVLIDYNQRSMTPVSHLDAEGEKNQVRRVIESSGVDIHTTYRHLSHESIGEELLNNPTILHISGHGLYADGSYKLALENDSNAAGSVSFLSVEDLTLLLSTSDVPKLVVLMACHSELAAQAFLSAGCPHVIAVKSTEKVLDRSARYFSKFLYHALVKGYTVKQAFNIACGNVSVAIDNNRRNGPNAVPAAVNQCTSPTLSSPTSPQLPPLSPLPPVANRTQSNPVSSATESSKFLLLPADGNHNLVFFPRKSATSGYTSPGLQHSSSFSSSCPASPTPCSPRSPSSPHSSIRREHSHRSKFSSTQTLNTPMLLHNSLQPFTLNGGILPSFQNSNLPAKPDFCVGREIETQQCVSKLKTNRVVNLWGPKRYGKSSVMLMAGHWFQDRHTYSGGVYYMSCAGIEALNETALVAQLCSVFSLNGIEHWHINSLRSFYQAIKDFDVLLLLDDLSTPGAQNLFLSLVKSTHRPKYIFTSAADARPAYPAECGISIQSVHVEALHISFCITLLKRLCADAGWQMTESQMTNFALQCNRSPYQMTARMREVAIQTSGMDYFSKIESERTVSELSSLDADL